MAWYKVEFEVQVADTNADELLERIRLLLDEVGKLYAEDCTYVEGSEEATT